MGVKRSLQSAGLSLGVLANVLVVLATATDFWSRFSDGHNGLWRMCRKNNCTNSSCETMLAVTAACVVLAAGSGLVASVLGIRVLHASRDGNLIPPRGRNACLVFFLSGNKAQVEILKPFHSSQGSLVFSPGSIKLPP
ncbi:claudin domain-containing protein 2 isoform X1 [Petaurus breviceps papuanus]|uniref:claudin domain-containing protein 2 isoform X1 n=1 Tax=Petaurus breviceps papuanus TaxID=3040969 RepID=UPI0036D867EF